VTRTGKAIDAERGRSGEVNGIAGVHVADGDRLRRHRPEVEIAGAIGVE
jgi:hypothetical protein